MTDLLPCRKCGSTDISLWHGQGTQAEMDCNECGEGESIQITDLLTYDERFSGNHDFNMETLSYPIATVDLAQTELVKEWNTRTPPIPSWQPIETAPKDGTEIIGYAFIHNEGFEPITSGPWTISFYGGKWRSSWDMSEVVDHMSDFGTDYKTLDLAPTHWMALPSSPNKVQNEN